MHANRRSNLRKSIAPSTVLIQFYSITINNNVIRVYVYGLLLWIQHIFNEYFQIIAKTGGYYTRTQHIIEVKEDMIFVWNEPDQCLFALNWKAMKAKGSSIKYQVNLNGNPSNNYHNSYKSMILVNSHGSNAICFKSVDGRPH